MGFADELFDLSGVLPSSLAGAVASGREMVRALARCGADVMITSRKLESCEELAQEIRDTTGRAALPYACHVGRWDELDGLVDAAYERFGTVDILINNAGNSPTYDAVDGHHRRPVEQRAEPQPAGAVPLVGAGGHADGGSRARLDHQHLDGRHIPTRPDLRPHAVAKAGFNNITESLAKAFGPSVRVPTASCRARFTRTPPRVGISKRWLPGWRGSCSSESATRPRSWALRSISQVTRSSFQPACCYRSTGANHERA